MCDGKVFAISPEQDPDVVALNEGLNDLAAIDEHNSRVVELRSFGGLNIEETAEVQKVSPKRVMRDPKGMVAQRTGRGEAG